MSLKRSHSVGRTTRAMLLAGVALSSGLSGCAQASDLAAHATKLSAAQDSDVLAPPTQQRYEVAAIDVSPAQPLQGATLPASITPSGYFVVGDGVITDARFEASFGDAQGELATASFQLTEPTVLRRIIGDDGSLTAVGTLSVGGVDRPGTSVQFSMISLDEQGAELLVLVRAPASVLEVGNNGAELEARISFNAM